MPKEKIWFEMDDNQNPVLVKESGERIVSDEHSKMFEQTVQSQQGWQRSRLFMNANDIWDATSFAATMLMKLLMYKRLCAPAHSLVSKYQQILMP